MRHLRAIFLLYLTLLLAWFVPAHTRGQITLPHGEKAESCCSSHDGGTSDTDNTSRSPAAPTEKEKANCAICFWAAGILPEVAAMFVVEPIDLALIQAREAIAQCSTWYIPAESLPRGPPSPIG